VLSLVVIEVLPEVIEWHAKSLSGKIILGCIAFGA
jgi:hypothetical protein